MNNDLAKIVEVVTRYYDGMYNRDIKSLKNVFKSNAMLFGYLNGELEVITFNEWLKKIESSPSPAELGEKYFFSINSVSINEKIATVTVEDIYHQIHFTDMLSLINIDDHWLIVNKTFIS